MKTYFCVIEWEDGSGKSSFLIEAQDAEDAFKRAQYEASITIAGEEHRGTVVAFNLVEED